MLHPKPTQGDSVWFVHDRFGLFIHWGLYALPARHEWVKSREEIQQKSIKNILNTSTQPCTILRSGRVILKKPG